jgi:hypothetical protein
MTWQWGVTGEASSEFAVHVREIISHSGYAEVLHARLIMPPRRRCEMIRDEEETDSVICRVAQSD